MVGHLGMTSYNVYLHFFAFGGSGEVLELS